MTKRYQPKTCSTPHSALHISFWFMKNSTPNKVNFSGYFCHAFIFHIGINASHPAQLDLISGVAGLAG